LLSAKTDIIILDHSIADIFQERTLLHLPRNRTPASSSDNGIVILNC